MVDDATIGVESAEARARIAALVIDADLDGSAVGIEHAFGFASLAGVAKVFRKALADGSAVLLAALSVGSAWRWNARVGSRPGCDFCDDG